MLWGSKYVRWVPNTLDRYVGDACDMHCDVDEGGSAWLKYMPPNFVMSGERVGTILEPILAHPQMQDLRRTRNERQRTSLRKMDVRFPRRVMTMNQAGLRFDVLASIEPEWWSLYDLYVIYMLYICCHYNDGLIIWFICILYVVIVLIEIAPPATEDCHVTKCYPEMHHRQHSCEAFSLTRRLAPDATSAQKWPHLPLGFTGRNHSWISGNTTGACDVGSGCGL